MVWVRERTVPTERDFLLSFPNIWTVTHYKALLVPPETYCSGKEEWYKLLVVQPPGCFVQLLCIGWWLHCNSQREFLHKNTDSGSFYFATDGQSTSLSWCRAPIWGPWPYLRSSCWGAPSLTRGRVCNLLVQFAVSLRAKSRRTHGHILLYHTRLPQPGGPDPCIHIPQEQGGPGHWVPFLSPLTTRRATVGVF
jgi:hypothetical protein